jgi:hypothetical protein
MKDVVAAQKRPYSAKTEYLHPPLVCAFVPAWMCVLDARGAQVVLNNFSGKEVEKRLMTAMFQNMFPAINVERVRRALLHRAAPAPDGCVLGAQIQLSECRRVVLFHYDSETRLVRVRHYVVTASPVGLTKARAPTHRASAPLHRLSARREGAVREAGHQGQDPRPLQARGHQRIRLWVRVAAPRSVAHAGVARGWCRQGAASDSEVEDTPDTRIVLPQKFAGRGACRGHRSRV